jgi:hypothetical protein
VAAGPLHDERQVLRGKDAKRPQLQAALDYLREGDTYMDSSSVASTPFFGFEVRLPRTGSRPPAIRLHTANRPARIRMLVAIDAITKLIRNR